MAAPSLESTPPFRRSSRGFLSPGGLRHGAGAVGFDDGEIALGCCATGSKSDAGESPHMRFAQRQRQVVGPNLPGEGHPRHRTGQGGAERAPPSAATVR